MPLTAYETDLQNLLQLPGAPATLYAQASLDLWINKARGQVALEGQCIRQLGSVTISAAAGVGEYNFSSIALGTASVTGVGGVINVRSFRYASGFGFQWVPPRSWEWFEFFGLNNQTALTGAPTMWAQYDQGASPGGVVSDGPSQGGGFYVWPPPNASYTVILDCVCYPISLANDATVEALPYPWSDAVTFLAAYYALLSAQVGAQDARAARMYQAYQEFIRRARMGTNPEVVRYQYEQARDPTIIGQLASQPQPPAERG
jgi:hypothetical protein